MTTEEALEFLFDPARDRYRGVYPVKRRGWRAMSTSEGKWSQVGTTRKTQREAALDLIKHLEGVYGERWTEVYTNGTGMSDSRPAAHTLRKTGRLYVVEVWVSGAPVEVTPDMVRDKSGAWAGAWATRKDAFRAMKEFRDKFRKIYDSAGRPAVMKI